MFRSSAEIRLALWLSLWIPLWVLACGGSRVGSEIPLDELPEYTAEDARLFDDWLDPVAFGQDAPAQRRPRTSVADLTQQADHVLKVRLRTVTRATIGGETRYLLALEQLGTLAGEPPRGELEVVVGLGSRSASLLRTLDTQALGTEFIIFLKSYRSNDQHRWHFSTRADQDSVRAEIQRVN